MHFSLEPGSEEENQDAFGKSCIIPRELCWGCKDGTSEGVKQRGKFQQGSRDPSCEMIPSTAWNMHFPGWNSAGFVCPEALGHWECNRDGASQEFLPSEGRKLLRCAGCSRDCSRCDPRGCSTEGTGPPLPPHSLWSTQSDATPNSHKTRTFQGLCIPSPRFPRGSGVIL